MPFRRRVLLSVVSTSILCSPVAFAETYVVGPVSGVWTSEGSPYIVTGDISVLAGTVLEIRPGVEVLFEAGLQLIVQGRLIAVGAETDSVTFAPWHGPTSPWGGIRFLLAEEGSRLAYSRLHDTRRDGQSHETALGSAIYSDHSSPEVDHCTFRNCLASAWEWETGYGGGAVLCMGGSPDFRQNPFEHCSVSACCDGGGGAICGYQTNIVIRGNRFVGCTAHGIGGAILLCESVADVSANIVSNCSGAHQAGAIGLMRGSSGRLFNNLIVDNMAADTDGGGIWVGWNVQDLEISFCTVAGNRAGSELGGWGGGVSVDAEAIPDIHDCILYGNVAISDGSQIYPASGVAVTTCDVQGGYEGTDNFDLDPLFVDSDPADRFYLSCVAAGDPVDSPCIDRADCSVETAGLSGTTTRRDHVADTGVADLGFHHVPLDVSDVAVGPSIPGIRILASPNPSSDRVGIALSRAPASEASLRILDVSGRVVRRLAITSSERTRVTWNGKDDAGRPVPPGVYFIRLNEDSPGHSATGRITVYR